MTEITLFYAALLALLMAVLSLRVPLLRAKFDQPWGDGDQPKLSTAIRVFGNFIEYVPMILLLMWMLEAKGASALFLHIAGSGLLTARVVHAISLTPDDMNRMQQVGRGIGAFSTWLILLACGIYLLMLVI